MSFFGSDKEDKKRALEIENARILYWSTFDDFPTGVYCVEIDGCQYLYFRSDMWFNFSVTHKGNCHNPIHNTK